MRDITVVHVPEECRRRFWQRVRARPQRRKFAFRRRLVDDIEIGRLEKPPDPVGEQGLLICRHEVRGDVERDDRDAVIVRRADDGWRTEELHHPTEVVVAAERKDIQNMAAQRRTPARDDRQAAAEADADEADGSCRRQTGFHRKPHCDRFNAIGDTRRDLEARQLGNVGCDDRDVGLGERACQPPQPRLVDARRMQAGDQQHRLLRVSERVVHARSDGRTVERHVHDALANRNRVDVADPSQRSMHIGGADDERESVNVATRGKSAEQQHSSRDADDEQRPSHLRLAAARRMPVIRMVGDEGTAGKPAVVAGAAASALLS